MSFSVTLKEYVDNVNTRPYLEVWLCPDCSVIHGPTPGDDDDVVYPLHGTHGVCDKCGCVCLFIDVYDVADFGDDQSKIH